MSKPFCFPLLLITLLVNLKITVTMQRCYLSVKEEPPVQLVSLGLMVRGFSPRFLFDISMVL